MNNESPTWRTWGGRTSRVGLVIAGGIILVVGIGMAVRAHLYPTPGAIVAFDASTGGELWRAPTPDADHNEISWVGRRLIVRATGSAYDRCDRYSDYLAVDLRSGATRRVPASVGESVPEDPLSDRFPVLVGEVRYRGRSYEVELPTASAPAVRSTTISVTGPGVGDYDVTVHWSVPRPAGIMPVATDGKIVLLAPPGNTYPQPGGTQLLRVLDTRDGHTLWSRPLVGFGTGVDAYVDYPAPTLLDGYVYAMTTPTTLSALNALTGRTVYSAEVGAGAIAARPDRVAVLASGRLSSVGKDGRVEWTRAVDARASGLVLDGRRVYVTVDGRHPSLLFCPPS